MIGRFREHRLYGKIGMYVLILLPFQLMLPYVVNFGMENENRSEKPVTSMACQPFTVSGADVRDNSRAFKTFLHEIKRQNGVLVLGTSETNAFIGQNYPTLLNKHFRMDEKFSYLAGAGRCAHIYFPTFLNNREEFKGLRILYFLNPTYWRVKLNEFNIPYYKRYKNLGEVVMVGEELEEYQLFEEFAEPFFDYMDTNLMVIRYASLMNHLRDEYHFMLHNRITQKNKVSELTCLDTAFSPPDSAKIKGLLNELNLGLNISNEFTKKFDSSFVQIDTSQFQYKSLEALILMSHEIGFELTVFVGPFNGVYAKQFDPESFQKHQVVLSRVLEILIENQVDYIDGTDLSYKTGTFIDLQHHSKYASWLISERIYRHYE